LTHYLAREDYGLLVWVGTIIALLAPFGLPGISTSITGAVAKGYDGNFTRGTWLEMAGGGLLADWFCLALLAITGSGRIKKQKH
jgi:O-antigen/teichoic acid export membrane protein